MNSKSVKRSYVSRSVYQKTAEGYKRLLADLKIILTGNPVEATLLKKHYRARFKREAEQNAELKELLTCALKNQKLNQ